MEFKPAKPLDNEDQKLFADQVEYMVWKDYADNERAKGGALPDGDDKLADIYRKSRNVNGFFEGTMSWLPLSVVLGIIAIVWALWPN